MIEPISSFPLLESQFNLPDERLRAVIARATETLADGKSERHEEALSEVKRIIGDSGLHVTMKRKPRKRGRPPKSAPV